MNDFSYWTTDKLGEMIREKRQRVREAQERFAASEREERRQRKRSYASEEAETRARRLEDELDAMRAELCRRAEAAATEEA